MNDLKAQNARYAHEMSYLVGIVSKLRNDSQRAVNDVAYMTQLVDRQAKELSMSKAQNVKAMNDLAFMVNSVQKLNSTSVKASNEIAYLSKLIDNQATELKYAKSQNMKSMGDLSWMVDSVQALQKKTDKSTSEISYMTNLVTSQSQKMASSEKSASMTLNMKVKVLEQQQVNKNERFFNEIQFLIKLLSKMDPSKLPAASDEVIQLEESIKKQKTQIESLEKEIYFAPKKKVIVNTDKFAF